MKSSLFGQDFVEKQTTDTFILQNERMLKVFLKGTTVQARQGAMVAYQGDVNFKYKGAGVSKFLKKAFTGEGMSLMEVSGDGDVFFANDASEIHLLYLENDSITCNGKNVLALEASLEWDIKMNKGMGVGGMMAGGLTNVVIQGTGWVALTAHGTPVVLQVDRPTFTDVNATVAWSTGLTSTIKKSDSMFKSAIGRGGGELFQMAFAGQGWVIVQASEGPVYVPTTN